MTSNPVLSERTLLLDVGYRPLSIVSVRRALLLLISEKAETVHESDHVAYDAKALVGPLSLCARA